jgi:hypothetical protein
MAARKILRSINAGALPRSLRQIALHLKTHSEEGGDPREMRGLWIKNGVRRTSI